MNLKEAFSSSTLLCAANPATMANLSSRATLKRVAMGTILFSEKEESQTLYIVARGMVALYKSSANGERRVVFLQGVGETLNEDAVSGRTSSVSCEALQDALFLCLPVDCVLLAMEQDFLLSKAMLDSITSKLRRLYHQVKNTSNSLRGDKRVAAKLWKLSRDFGVSNADGTTIAFDLSITFLADMLGSKRETVSRQVKTLTELGLVLFERRRFLIPDRDALNEYYKLP